jgi:hypothetical protein
MLRTLLLVLSLMAAACGGSPPGVPDGVQRLIGDLSAAGGRIVEAGSFDAAPLSGQAALMCVNGQEVRVYSYPSDQERAAAASRIDPTDPSNVGTAIIDWAGNPRFWQRDRIVVLYLGRDQATEALLTTILGPPFARGLGRDPGPRGLDC